MTNALVRIKINERLNKIASFDYDNIECWQITEAFNKAQLEWVRRQVRGYNLSKDGEEGSKMNIDDLQPILVQYQLTSTQNNNYYETELIPADYLYYKRVSVSCVSSCCPDPRPMTVYLAEMGDIDNLLSDELRKPSDVWGETFCTLSSNRIRIYTDGEFELSEPILHYFRKPVEIAFAGCASPSNGVVSLVDVPCEFKDDVVELIIDNACAILAGDIESMTQYQRAAQNSNSNT